MNAQASQGLNSAVVGRDFLASIVVFLVALPLCMGIAIASGAPPALGLITGIVGGLVVGSIAGSPLQVSGPAAGMAVLVFQLVDEHGLIMLGVVGLIAGALQLLAGVFRLGQWFRAISPSVIHGMLAGIGVLIFASQFHVMLDDAPRSGGLANLAAIPEAIIKVFPADGSVHHLAAMAGIITISTIIAWNKFKPKTLALLPGPLLGVIVGTIFALVFALPITLVAVPANLTDALNIPTPEALAGALDREIITLGIVFAFVASAETLLCATAVDKMHIGARTQYDKELRAQGIGNIICGALGALPMTGVIVRSAANVEAGATTRISAILHGAWLLLAVAAFPFVLNQVPTAVLAAILVYTGYKLVNVAQIRKIAEFGRQELAIYFVTLIGVVAIDLLTGVILGFVLATLKLVYTFSHLSIDVTHDKQSNRTDVWMTGSATFFSIPQLSGALESTPRGAEVHIHVEKLDYIDHACLEMLSSWEKLHQSTGGSLTVEWNALVQAYGRRSQDPSRTEIPALMQRPAA
ncbi:SulP family inorganic anion transporter [Erythrobacter sp. sf7]|uniref:SulP family inorganic anion transporter n=1 Tax=Erythrobacter fulvus TaxID=2987523 RepID=A0ABT5JMK8_9SPHN|nr:SulP family inorganic anion transporter [Erythrobacter fulvus]MDC8753998.1 SulP family inorganic anion transporter [Erythrobacter fulvus]